MSNKKLVVTSASLLVTSALLVVTKKLVGDVLLFYRFSVKVVKAKRSVNLDAYRVAWCRVRPTFVSGVMRSERMSTSVGWRPSLLEARTLRTGLQEAIRNKKLVVTSATLLVTGALLVETACWTDSCFLLRGLLRTPHGD